MARQKVTHTVTTIKSKKPTGNLMKCNVCGGTGYQRKPNRKKKK